MPKPLFSAEFPTVTTAEWMAVVEKDLKGADFEKRLVWSTDEGLRIRPFHRSEDLPASAQAPGVRGFEVADATWSIRERIRAASTAEANQQAHRALARGVEQVCFQIYPCGVGVLSQQDMQALVAGLDLSRVHVYFAAGPLAAQTLAMYLNEAERQGVAFSTLRGGVDADPILDGCLGWREGGLDGWEEESTPLVAFDAQNLPAMRSLSIRATAFQEAGASAAQELAYGLSVLTEYLGGLNRRQLNAARTVAQAEAQFGIGANYLLEIAKIRAARLLIARVLQAFGIEDARPRIHAEVTRMTKTLYDPYVNLLRATTEAMSAAVAGADSISVLPHDALYADPTEATTHVARNIQHLLRDEAYLAKVADPLGGSYTIESMTHALAQKAWELFQGVEKAGGFVAAWSNGAIPAALAETRSARTKAAGARRSPIVGTSNYPNLKETAPATTVASAAPKRALRAFAVGDSFTGLREAVGDGSMLDAWLTDTPVESGPLDVFRPAGPYEQLRLDIERHVAEGKKRPKVLLALAGDAKMRKARAAFCTGFFGAGGYEVVESRPYKEVAEAATDASDADLVVLCSSDEEYETLLPELLASLPAAKAVLIAGSPPNSDHLKAAGAYGFVHIRQDVPTTLREFHNLLGIQESAR